MLPDNYHPKAGDCIYDGYGMSIFVLVSAYKLGMIRLSDSYCEGATTNPITILYTDTVECAIGEQLHSGWVTDQWVFLGHVDFPKIEKKLLASIGLVAL
jgi:uncharacterized membrane protein